MKQRLGVTFKVPSNKDAVGVYKSDAGVEAFETDVPYVLSDEKSLADPLPVKLVDGPVFADTLGNAQTALAISIGDVPPPPLPANTVVNNGVPVVHGGVYVVHTS